MDVVLLTVIWAGPIIALQWLFGFDVLVRRWKVWVAATAALTAYLMLVAAIGRLSITRAIGPAGMPHASLPILDTPLPDAVLWLCLSLIVVQAMILLMYQELLFRRIQRFGRIIMRNPFRPRRSQTPGNQDQPGTPDQAPPR